MPAGGVGGGGTRERQGEGERCHKASPDNTVLSPNGLLGCPSRQAARVPLQGGLGQAHLIAVGM